MNTPRLEEKNEKLRSSRRYSDFHLFGGPNSSKLLAFQRLRSSRTALLDVKAFGLLTVPVGFPGYTTSGIIIIIFGTR